MRKALLFIASVLLAATASAQIGSPGLSAPPPYQLRAGASTFSLNATTGTILGSGQGTVGQFSFTGSVTSGTNLNSYALLTYGPTGQNFAQSHVTATYQNDRYSTMSSTSQGLTLQDGGTSQLFPTAQVGWQKNISTITQFSGSQSLEKFMPLTGQYHSWFGQQVKKSYSSNTDQYSGGWNGGYWGDASPFGHSQWNATVYNMNPAATQTASIDVYVDHTHGSGAYASLEVSYKGIRVKERANGATNNPLGMTHSAQYDGAWEGFIPGSGLSLPNNPTLSPDGGITAEAVDVFVTDTTDSVNAGNIWVCGQETTVYGPVICEALSLVGLPSPGPTTLTTTKTYVAIWAVKVVGAGVLGGGSDESVTAEWADSNSSLFGAQDLVNHASKGTVTISTDFGNFYDIACQDPNGCDLAVGAIGQGAIMTLVGASGTQDTLVADGATIKLAGGVNFTIQPTDVLQLIYSKTNAAYVEVSRSDN